jgi:FkbH-like protein
MERDGTTRHETHGVRAPKGRGSMSEKPADREDRERAAAEAGFPGTREEFLRGLEMRLRIFEPGEADLDRAAELTVRASRWNSTGVALSREEIAEFVASDRHTVLLTSLEDRFGAGDRTGLAVVGHGPGRWTIQGLCMSRRVASRGVGEVLLQHLMLRASQVSVRLFADYVPNDRNGLLEAVWRDLGFRNVGEEGGRITLEADHARLRPFPDWIEIRIS